MQPLRSVELYGDPRRGAGPRPATRIRSTLAPDLSPGWQQVQFQVAAEAHALQVVAAAGRGGEVSQPLRQILVYAANHLPADPLLSIADSGRLIGLADLASAPASTAGPQRDTVAAQRDWVALLLESPAIYNQGTMRQSVAISAATRAVREGNPARDGIYRPLSELLRMLSLGSHTDRAIALTLLHMLTDTTPVLATAAVQALLRAPGAAVEADPLGFATTAVRHWHRAHRRSGLAPSLTAEQLAGTARALRISYSEGPRP